MAEHYYPDRENAPYGMARLGDKYNVLEVFDKFPKKEKKFYNYYNSILMVSMVVTGITMITNLSIGKNLFHKPHVTLLVAVAAGSISYAALQYRERAEIRTAAIVRDYVRLHPDRFPSIERKKFKDSLHQWYEERWLN